MGYVSMTNGLSGCAARQVVGVRAHYKKMSARCARRLGKALIRESLAGSNPEVRRNALPDWTYET